jgi:hypothetical protein
VVKVTKTCGTGANPFYHIFLPTDNVWACLQLLGYVYDRVNTSTACSTAGVTTIQYRLRMPVDGLMVCGPGTWNGCVYDFAQPTILCTLTRPGTMYPIRALVDNLWSCTHLIGFVYDKLELDAECDIGSTAVIVYHLQKPVDRLWACEPGTYNGFTYDQI